MRSSQQELQHLWLPIPALWLCYMLPALAICNLYSSKCRKWLHIVGPTCSSKPPQRSSGLQSYKRRQQKSAVLESRAKRFTFLGQFCCLRSAPIFQHFLATFCVRLPEHTLRRHVNTVSHPIPRSFIKVLKRICNTPACRNDESAMDTSSHRYSPTHQLMSMEFEWRGREAPRNQGDRGSSAVARISD